MNVIHNGWETAECRLLSFTKPTFCEEVCATKGNPQKKLTFEDKFDRKFACWVKNRPKAWRRAKQQARKQFRKIQKRMTEETLNEEEAE